MLIITRRNSEAFSIIIGNRIIAKVSVLEINGNQAIIGFMANKKIKMYRDEVIERSEDLKKTLILDIG